MPYALEQDIDGIIEHVRPALTELRGQRLFLTGGTGFFGRWLLHTLTRASDQLKLNARVHVLTRDPENFQKLSPELAAHPSVHLERGDVRSFPFPKGNFSHIIHGATEASVTLNTENPKLMYDTIIEGTKRVLEFSESCHASKILLISSGAVYGTQPSSIIHMPEDEEAVQKPLQIPSAYAEGKREAERLWNRAGSKATRTTARCFAFVGPYLPLTTHFAIGNFIHDVVRGGPIRIKGDGTPFRSYLYVADLVEWLLTILSRGKNGRAYNVGSENGLTISELAHAVASACTPSPAIEIGKKPVPGSLPERYVPSTARAQQELGLIERTSLDTAIRSTISWYSSSL